MSDAKVLVYNDVLLRECDVDTLRNHGWLNDQIINFYFQFLEAEQGRRHGYRFVDPAFSFLLLNAGEEDIADLVDSAEFNNSLAVFFAISDNTDPGVAYGGSHWSLLLYLPADVTFIHYDSCEGSHNVQAARKLATVVARQVWQQEALEFRTEETPQQANMYDCGLYVLAGAHILSFELGYAETMEDAAYTLGSTATPEAVLSFREWLVELIISLATEQDHAVKGIQQHRKLEDCPIST